MRTPCFSGYFRTLAVAVALAFCVVRPAAATDYTDIWWNSLESGWGVNFIQADDFIFATFFIYGPALQPVWYTGQMSRDSNGVWSGPLYLTAGTYFGAPWNPAQRTAGQVGTVTFSPSSSHGGMLTYNVDNVVVTRQLTRQTLKTIVLGGGYFGGVVADVYNCTNPLHNATVRFFAEVVATQTTGGVIQLDFTTGNDTCSIVGNYLQDGQLYRIPVAAYTCANGLSTTAAVSELKATNFGLEGRWIAPVSGGCTEAGTFSFVLR